jgi:hypothetical protein
LAARQSQTATESSDSRLGVSKTEDYLMNRFPVRARVSTRTVRVREDRRHKFDLGAVVTLVKGVGEMRPKAGEQDVPSASFEITRLLPEQDRSFQYRIKHAATGRERVVAEDQIASMSA